MHALRPVPLIAALAAACFCQAAAASTALPTLPSGGAAVTSFQGLALNQWYVLGNHLSAATWVPGAITQDGSALALPGASDLVRQAAAAPASGSALASALAQVSTTRLGAKAWAGEAATPLANAPMAMGYASVVFAAVLDQDVRLSFDLRLDGSLTASDPLTPGAGAAVAALAFGSTANYQTEHLSTAFAAAGLDAYAEDEAFIRQYSTLQSTRQTHLDTFGAQTRALHNPIAVDSTLTVTAEGTRLDCDPGLSPVCGHYAYFFGVMLFTAAQDGGLADFSHTLQVSSYRVDGGPALAFEAVSAVPEPSAALLLGAGLCALVWRRRR